MHSFLQKYDFYISFSVYVYMCLCACILLSISGNYSTINITSEIIPVI